MVRDNNNPDDDDNVSCPFVIRKDRIPPDNRKRPTVPILRYGDLYYCFADLVIGPVLPTVYLTLPSFAYASYGEPYVCERKRTGTYPKGGGWENGAGRDIVPIGPVPICYRDVMGDTVTTYEQWVDDYRDLPGVPFYSTTYGSGDRCDKASRYDIDGSEAYEHAMFYIEEAMRAHTNSVGTLDSVSDIERAQYHGCVKLAEILFRHAAGRGHARAWLALGRIYHDDINEGDYFNSCYTARIKGHEPIVEQPPIAERARICFERAAELGEAEALAFLGDLRLQGRVCRRDARRAFALYEQAYARADEDGQVKYAKAAAAARLARCLAYGVGCGVDTPRALTLFQYASEHLADIARDNPRWYEDARTGAQEEVIELTTSAGDYEGAPEAPAVVPAEVWDAISYAPITKHLPMLEQMDDFGTPVIPFWFSYHDDVERFIDDVFRFADDHPELDTSYYLGFVESAFLDTPIERIDPADCDARTVFMMVFYAVRYEKFYTGLLAGLLRGGAVQRWLRRLKQLDDEQ